MYTVVVFALCAALTSPARPAVQRAAGAVVQTGSVDCVAPRPRALAGLAGSVHAPRMVPGAEEFLPVIAAFEDALERSGELRPGAPKHVAPEAAGAHRISFERDSALAAESYTIAPDERGLVVKAANARGIARATATLFQLAECGDGSWSLPKVRVEDSPDRPFRCFMVDLGRTPHPPAILRQIVDLCWMYKVGYLQLHLSDDQLFSWTSRAFPKLHDQRAGWALEDFVALEAYASARGVALIPELDVPGHSTLLRERYPAVFGETPTDLATDPSATQGVQQLIDELLETFRSSPFVHIGGDEAYGVPADVQRRFLNRIAAHVRERGRRAIVWEGPPLGEGDDKVDTDVLQMNWHTVGFPAQEMLDAGYEVINASWDPLYIVDHYPRTMFTGAPVERCYSWDARRFAQVDPGFPTFLAPHLTRSDAGIVGFCMPWWEGRPEYVLAMCAPRLAAVASAAWNRAGEDDYADFAGRQARLLPRLERLTGAALLGAPYAEDASQAGNLAFRARVTTSWGASQPVFGPERLTNGLVAAPDHFLGYPTQPEPLEVTLELRRPETIGRIVVHEVAVGESYEVYDVLVSRDGAQYEVVGTSGEGTRGAASFVAHRFEPRVARFVKLRTRGCHGLTFPSFSRLTEVQAFRD
ncbi:MAG: family 20 glycosylhydrolase [Planctomycetota bacterium]